MDTFYIVACSPLPTGGIYHCRLSATEKLDVLDFVHLPSSNWLLFSKDRRHAYATCAFGEGTGVASYEVNGDGSLKEIGRVSSAGKAACHLAFSPDEKRLFCANYTTGSMAEFAVGEDGRLSEVTRLLEHHGHGVNPLRQERAHIHCTVITPDEKYVVINDLGLDQVCAVPLDGGPEKVSVIPPFGGGPRHIIFAPCGKLAYMLTEMGSAIHTLEYNDGEFRQIDMISTLPAGFKGFAGAAAIRFSPDGKFVIASNRGQDTLAGFRIGEKGRLEPAFRVPTKGHFPRDFNFLPGGRMIAAANELSNRVTFFHWHPDGVMVPSQLTFQCPGPLAVTSFQFP